MKNQKPAGKPTDDETNLPPQAQPSMKPQSNNQLNHDTSQTDTSEFSSPDKSQAVGTEPTQLAEEQHNLDLASPPKAEQSNAINNPQRDKFQVTLNPIKSPKRSKKKLIVTILAALLIIGAGAMAAVYTYLNNKPEKVLADVLANTASDLLERKPSSVFGEVMYESKGDNPIKLTIKFNGKNSADNGEGYADINLTFAEQTYYIKTSAVILGEEEVYFKLENLKSTLTKATQSQPAFSQYTSMVDPVITKIDDRWIKVTKDDFKQAGLADEQKVNKCTAAVSKLRLSGADKKELKKIFESNQFMVARETLPNETISDERSFHYKLDFNNQSAQNFTKQIINMESFKAVKTDCEINEKAITDGFNQTQEAARQGESAKPVVELWAGKKSRRPTKFRVQAFNKEASVDFASKVKLDAKNITIEKPENSLSITELQSEIDKLMQPSTSSL